MEEELRTPLARPALELCSPKKTPQPARHRAIDCKNRILGEKLRKAVNFGTKRARGGAKRRLSSRRPSLTFEGRPPPKPFVMADEESKQGEEAKPNTMQLKVVSQDGTEGVLLLPHVPPLCTHAQWLPSSLSAGDRQ